MAALHYGICKAQVRNATSLNDMFRVSMFTGEMVRAMSAQKKDLARRLKAAESSNRQLRGELQHFRAGLRCLPQSAADSQHAHTGDTRGTISSLVTIQALTIDLLRQTPDTVAFAHWSLARWAGFSCAS